MGTTEIDFKPEKRGLKVCLIQADIEWANTQANVENMRHQLLGAPPSDLYVLPEMWSTGFITSPTPSAVADWHLALGFMQEMATKLDAAVSGSLAVQAEDGTYRNRLFFVTPSDVSYYDKRHLFTYGGEDKHYTAGSERVVVEWRGVRFLLQVCYDLRFPVFARNKAEGASAYDAILYVASWPVTRIEVWKTLLRARAIENQCYVFGVNRIGTDPVCQYSGATLYVDPYGRSVQCPDDTAHNLIGIIDMERLQSFRKKFPVLADAD